jgi:hypothetical protein
MKNKRIRSQVQGSTFRVAFPLIPALYAVCRRVRTEKDIPFYDL